MQTYQKRNTKAVRPDFSKQAVAKAVRKEGIQHPLVLYPAAVGILGGLAALLISPGYATIGTACVGIGVSAIALVANLFLRKKSIADRYIQELRELNSLNLERSKSELKQKLYDLGNKRAFHQLEKLEDKYDLLERILSEKLNPGEITFKRYLGMAEQVFFSVMDSLQEAVSRSQAISAIDIKYIESRLNDIENSDNLSPEAESERASLIKRREIFHKQKEEITTIMSQNEEAMTVIDETTAAISGITTKRGRSTLDMESAMKELTALAERADDYSIRD
ncbi:MAG: hypothetical protein D6B27_10195 [Gammaproteobacteria bacterium]|nr:MAG: hypothetical protein D6B27_10195 [Gammaproteobacteria bacterium]